MRSRQREDVFCDCAIVSSGAEIASFPSDASVRSGKYYYARLFVQFQILGRNGS